MTASAPKTENRDWEKPLPNPSTLTRPFWESTKSGVLSIQRCTTCGTFVWTPQMACRECLTETLEWTPVSGRGEVYCFVVMHRAANPAFTAPYTVAIVRLEEGPYMVTDIIDIDPSEVAVGMPVEVSIELAGDVGLHHFRPRS